jgi:hypothetical protein
MYSPRLTKLLLDFFLIFRCIYSLQIHLNFDKYKTNSMERRTEKVIYFRVQTQK